MINFSSIDAIVPNSFYNLEKLYRNSWPKGNSISLYRGTLDFNANVNDIEVFISKSMLDEEVRSRISFLKKEEPGPSFWAKSKAIAFNEKEAIESMTTVSVFVILRIFCQLASDYCTESPIILRERVQAAITLFDDITGCRYNDLYVIKTCLAWLPFNTLPLCSTHFIYDEKDRIIWFLFWNNWNF